MQILGILKSRESCFRKESKAGYNPGKEGAREYNSRASKPSHPKGWGTQASGEGQSGEYFSWPDPRS